VSPTSDPGKRSNPVDEEGEKEEEDFLPTPKGKASATGWLGGWGIPGGDQADNKPQEPDWVNDWAAPVKVDVNTDEPDSD